MIIRTVFAPAEKARALWEGSGRLKHCFAAVLDSMRNEVRESGKNQKTRKEGKMRREEGAKYRKNKGTDKRKSF